MTKRKSSKKHVPPRHNPGAPGGLGLRGLAGLAVAFVAISGAVAFVWSYRATDATSAPAGAIPAVDAVSTSTETELRHEGVVPRELSSGVRKSLQSQYACLDPLEDGWSTEAFNDVAGSQLSKLGKLLDHLDEVSPGDLTELASESFRCGPIRPLSLDVVFRDASLTVLREPEDKAKPTPGQGDETYTGAGGLLAALRQLAEPLAGMRDVRAKFKIIVVEPDDAFVQTVAYFEASGRGDQGAVQQNATWHCRWSTVVDGPPRLEWIGSERFEQVVTSRGEPLMADCTEAVLGANDCYREQLLHSTEYWVNRMQAQLGMDYIAHNGIAVEDVNGDGLEDLYVCQPGGLPNRLFVQNPDGTATDRAAEAGVDYLESTRCAVFADFNGNGHQDLLLVTITGILLMSNDGEGNFTLEAKLPQLTQPNSASVADFDNDGDLDVYLTSYAAGGVFGSGVPTPYHDANNGGPNVLLRNDGDWQFTDVTVETGLDENNRRWSFACAWGDYNNDGWLDLYVANDFGRNNLYRNIEGRFVDVAGEAGVEDIAAGMSVSWGDFNADGLLDLYVSNMFSSAGSRVTYQRKFKDDLPEETRAQFKRHARGNTLFENAGDGTFRDVSVEADVTMGRWAWGSTFVDLNNNGYEDIVVANGFLTSQATDDL